MSKYLDEILEEIEKDFDVSKDNLSISENLQNETRRIDSITYLDLLDSYIDSALNYKSSYGILALENLELPALEFSIDLCIAYNYDKYKLKNIILKAKAANITIKLS